MIISLDISLRSTGLCAVDENQTLLNFGLIKSKPNEGKTKKDKANGLPILNDEDLIIYNTSEVIKFIEQSAELEAIDAIVIEGLSFNSLSGNRDLIDGNFWAIRVGVRKKYPHVHVEIVSVQSWRNKILNKADREIAKRVHGKGWQKKGVVDKLPEGIKAKFMGYLKWRGYEPTGLYDLADSFSLNRYYLENR